MVKNTLANTSIYEENNQIEAERNKTGPFVQPLANASNNDLNTEMETKEDACNSSITNTKIS